MNEISAIRPQPVMNVEAEQQTLGAILLDATRLDQIADARDLFADPVHSDIFEEVRRRHNAGMVVSPVALKDWAQGHVGIRELGGPGYLARLAGASISGGQVRAYAAILADLRDKRGIQSAVQRAIAEIGEGRESAADIAGRLEGALTGTSASKAGGPVSMLAAITDAIQEADAAYRGEGDARVMTGINSLDRYLGGLHPGDMVILAGRPSMGKSAVALNMALNVARDGGGVVIASLEMTPSALAHRAIAEETGRMGRGVNYSTIRRGEMTEAQYRTVVDAAKKVADLPIQFLPVEYRDMNALYAGVKRSQSIMGETVGLKLVVVDYLQLLRADGKSRYEQITEISIALKGLAQRLGVPVLALSQLSRQVEQRDDKRPTLSDIRESGQLEQDADAVVFCYRDEYYLEREQPDAGKPEAVEAWSAALERARNQLELIVAKNRGGEIGTARVKFNPALNVIWESQR